MMALHHHCEQLMRLAHTSASSEATKGAVCATLELPESLKLSWFLTRHPRHDTSNVVCYSKEVGHCGGVQELILEETKEESDPSLLVDEKENESDQLMSKTHERPEDLMHLNG